ncbi:MAG: type II toxin-antitoxin system VapC family toxin [bacterium]|nr:type II toxin-antitoxin system VapC family toxin [bacterium]
MIVADTNVTVHLFVAGNLSQAARQLFAYDGHWIVPPVWPHEFLNVMATYGKSGGLSVHRCVSTWRRAWEIFGPRIVPVDNDAALSLAIRHRLSGYDAQFIRLAHEHGVTYVTEDRRLREAFPDSTASVEGYLSGN